MEKHPEKKSRKKSPQKPQDILCSKNEKKNEKNIQKKSKIRSGLGRVTLLGHGSRDR